MTSVTLELTAEEVERSNMLADQTGADIDSVLHRLIAQAPDANVRPMTGAEALANLEAAGVLGTFSDRPDSPVRARQLREASERRGA